MQLLKAMGAAALTIALCVLTLMAVVCWPPQTFLLLTFLALTAEFYVLL